jgi:acid phosphatase type 7
MPPTRPPPTPPSPSPSPLRPSELPAAVRPRIVFIAFVALLFACGPPPIEELEPEDWSPPPPAECGEGVAPGSFKQLARWPYLQRVGEDRIVVAWGGATGSVEGELRFGRDAVMGQRVAAERERVASDGGSIELFAAALDGLGRGVDYCYGVEIDGVLVASGMRFRTAPPFSQQPFRFAAIGDFGVGTAAQRAVRDQLASTLQEGDWIVTMGDNAYGAGDWDEWERYVFDVYRRELLEHPFFPTPGNHDYATDDLAPYLANLFLPENAWRVDEKERYWAADVGPVHFVGLDTEDSLMTSASDDMEDWLAGDLAAQQRPWPIALFHHPPLTGHPSRNDNLIVQARISPHLEEHGVVLALAGHDHFYQRFQPLRYPGPAQPVVTPTSEGGVTYVIGGGGGRGLYNVEEHELEVLHEKRHHFLYVEADVCTLNVQVIADDGEVLDEFGFDRC